jgi:hypothetical protein
MWWWSGVYSRAVGKSGILFRFKQVHIKGLKVLLQQEAVLSRVPTAKIMFYFNE